MNEQHFYASNFILETVTGRKDTERPDSLGTGHGKTAYNIALRLNGQYICYTIRQAETAAQALLLGIEALILNASPQILRSAELVEVISVRESA